MHDIIEIEIFNKLLSSIAEEMGIILTRSSFSPNIKERRDFSCAIFDSKGELAAQAAHIPVHLGSMPKTLEYVLKTETLEDGDIIITNDPFHGGSHLPDITLVQAVYHGSLPRFFVVNRAHHADVGGKVPGSMGLTRSLRDEGVLIPPSFLSRKGKANKAFYDAFLSKVRNPWERKGDLRAQIASVHRGRARLLELLDKYGADRASGIIDHLKDYAERLMRSAIAPLPDGTFSFTDFLDNDGYGRKAIPISVEVTIRKSDAVVDFSKSADQVATPLNTVESVTLSATLYAFQCLLGEGYPINQGSHRPLRVKIRPGSILNAEPPSPVAAGNVETSQRIVDVLFGALAQALPSVIPAASCGSMNNITIGGPGFGEEEYTYYETIGGGMGARTCQEGLDGIHTHMTNTMNTPIEALEHAYPFQIARYGLRRGSGGGGTYKGGEGIIRSYRFLKNAEVGLLTERRTRTPYGLAGGSPGAKGENILIRSGTAKKLAGKVNFQAKKDDLLVIKTPGGGGWGIPYSQHEK